MKRLLVILMTLSLVGCSSNGTSPRTTETPVASLTPAPTEVVVKPTIMPHPNSKINIDLYKSNEYYPVVDGVVTYPDGTTEEFNNGYEAPENMTVDYILYADNCDSYSEYATDKEMAAKMEYGGYLYVEKIHPTMCALTMSMVSDDYIFTQSSEEISEKIVDGVFGIEYIGGDSSPLPYVMYRYSNYIPKGESINDSFRITSKEIDYYVWRIKDYDDLEGFDEAGLTGEYGDYASRKGIIWWGAQEGQYIPPHSFTFE